jgi:hypothetical protein
MKAKRPAIAAINDKLLSRPSLGERWECSIETIKRREREGALKALRIGGRVKYRLSDILAFEREAEVA